MTIEKINLAKEALSLQDYWKLKNIGQLNNHELNLIKLDGPFEWHTHEDEDKLFMVVDGVLEVHFRDKIITLEKNECIIIPKGIENKPVAKDQATLVIIEPQRAL